MTNAPAPFPASRPRRLRQAPWIRELLAETRLHVTDLIWPVFVTEGGNENNFIASMPGVSRLGLESLVIQAKQAHSLGIPAIALFPQVNASRKSARGEEALNPENLVCRAIKAVKNAVPELGIITDVALDPYTTHGHDGIYENGDVANDATVEVLCQQALLQAQAGCDIVAPSDMMDGRVSAIRRTLEQHGHHNTMILSYAAKYASAMYGPFRDAVGSAPSPLGGGPGWGHPSSGGANNAPLPTSPLRMEGYLDKRTYQMNPANSAEAMREIALDVAEGADMVMVKPGIAYLDIVARASAEFNVPVLAYQVSGEYAMIQAASANGWIDGDAVMLEQLLAFKRAGAAAVLTYAAVDVAKGL